MSIELTEAQQAEIKSQLTAIDTEKRYDEMLDDTYGDAEIAGMKFCTSMALFELDETAYHCGMSDWLDSEVNDDRLVEINGEYYDADEVQEVIDKMEVEL